DRFPWDDVLCEPSLGFKLGLSIPLWRNIDIDPASKIRCNLEIRRGSGTRQNTKCNAGQTEPTCKESKLQQGVVSRLLPFFSARPNLIVVAEYYHRSAYISRLFI